MKHEYDLKNIKTVLTFFIIIHYRLCDYNYAILIIGLPYDNLLSTMKIIE